MVIKYPISHDSVKTEAGETREVKVKKKVEKTKNNFLLD